MSQNPAHETVLLQEAVDALNIKPEGKYIDGTFGRGGHSSLILSQLNDGGNLMAIDKDPQAITEAESFHSDGRFQIRHGSFAQMLEFCESCDWVGKVDGILLDLGVSSPQLDQAERGFSFTKDGPLDMRMDPTCGISAQEWIEKTKEEEMARVFKQYGEERFARRIARAIAVARTEKRITTTGQLAEIISEANPAWEKHKHPATRCFQAIRIEINAELRDIESVLEQVYELLAPAGRIVVISFHSLEDRLIKRFFKQQSKGDDFPKDLPVTVDQLKPKFKLLSRGIKPGKTEVEHNVRARSAVMRIAEKVA